MTIYDILVNCASVQSDTMITIISSVTHSVKRQCFLKNLESKYEVLHFNYFTVGYMLGDNKPKLSIKFYV